MQHSSPVGHKSFSLSNGRDSGEKTRLKVGNYPRIRSWYQKCNKWSCGREKRRPGSESGDELQVLGNISPTWLRTLVITITTVDKSTSATVGPVVFAPRYSIRKWLFFSFSGFFFKSYCLFDERNNCEFENSPVLTELCAHGLLCSGSD